MSLKLLCTILCILHSVQFVLIKALVCTIDWLILAAAKTLFELLVLFFPLFYKEAGAALVSWLLYWFQHSSLEKFVELLVCHILEMAGCGKWNHVIGGANFRLVLNEL